MSAASDEPVRQEAPAAPRAPHDPIALLAEILIGLLGLALIAAIATVPLAPRDQAVFGCGSIVLFLIANRAGGRAMTLLLMAVSLAVSLRYIAWRAAATLDFATWTETVLGAGLVLAEFYAIVVLALGYLQTAWPLGRTPRALPADPATWPSVDVFIPTHSEPLGVVRATVLGALAMDWPADRLRVHLLDDGRRDEFRRFAADVGCRYLTRADNAHAKAGNLNAAMARTEGEFVVVFDCDHIPTRAFLQLTLGWLVADAKLAVVQTPQHCYSPDPFQRNLAAGVQVPPEQNLFHGWLQDGNDFWGAALFSGSGAVLRRRALAGGGNFAVESVTEDALTMLRLHRRGWGSAYLRAPLAAGLATETLGRHIAQRRRWARGMLQILRLDNPLIGRGLSLGQRLCYLQACGHFLFALPRVVFLTAPLAFLLLGQNVIAASPLAITAYAVPHLFHAVATRARSQRNWRHSFWGEIYETVLALALVRVTLATLLAPRRGRFGVTAKGGVLASGFFDLQAVWPNLVLALLLLLGIVRGVVGITVFQPSTQVFDTLLMNAIWAGLSLLTVLAALAVGRETRQVAARAGVTAALPMVVRLADGRAIGGMTRELSQAGAQGEAARPDAVRDDAEVSIEVKLGGEILALPAQVVAWDEAALQVRWRPATLLDETSIVRAVFGRADAWTGWADDRADLPLASLWSVLASIGGLWRGRRGLAKGLAGGVVGLTLMAASPAWSQTATQPPAPPKRSSGGGMTVRVIPQPLPDLRLPTNTAPPSPVATPPPSQVATPPPSPPAPRTPAPAAAPAVQATEAVARTSARRTSFTLRQFGAAGPLALRGTSPEKIVTFGVGADEVVTGAQLSLTGAMSPSLIPEVSNITVTLNGQYVATIPASRDQATFQVDLPISPVFFQAANKLAFRFAGRYAQDCNDPLSGLLWGTVNDSSSLTMTVERLPPRRDLSRLPQPFLDSTQKELLTLPFVMAGSADDESLRAAGIVASWFGDLASKRGATFPVVAEAPAEGNAVIVLGGAGGPAMAGLPPINGPTLAVVANPNDALGSLLVVAGRNGAEAATAATALAVGGRLPAADAALVPAPQVAPRVPYDAPAWIATDRPVRFGELVDAAELQSTGYVGLLHVPFRTAPDLFVWRDRPFAMALRYRAPAPVVDLPPSRLDVGINGIYLDTLPLVPAERSGWLSWPGRLFGGTAEAATRIGIPAADVLAANDLQFHFDARPLQRGDCAAPPPDLHLSVDPDSTIDLRAGHRFAELPNLSYFAGSGFPFTRLADLSETAVVLPERPGSVEVSAFLDMMGRFGAVTGYPAIRVAVVRPAGVGAVADRDLLAIGTMAHMQDAGPLLAGTAVQLSGRSLTLAASSPLESVLRLFDDGSGRERERVAAVLAPGIPDSTAVLAGGQSPLRPGRSVVALLAASPQMLGSAVAVLRADAALQGDLALLSAGRATSFRVTRPYTVGALPFWMWPGWMLHDRPYRALLVMVLGCVLLGGAMYWLLRRRAGRLSGSSVAGP